MAEPLLELRGAAFGYGDRAVLSGLDLDVRPGEVLGILGPNGAGKTTLVRGVLGLLPPLRGRVVSRARALGYVPQRESLDPLYPVTVREVVDTGGYGRLRGLRRPTRADRELARRSLERVGLEGRERAPFSSLSGGQRQRALLARALMVHPDLLVLDEPTSGVDPPAARAILDLVHELAEEDSLAILLVSHQLALLREAATDVLWVADGTARRGPARELLDPARLEELFLGGGAP